jgi:hypothetical protein
MAFVLTVTAIFIVISIYFFFRAERLQRQIILTKRESHATRKEIKTLLDTVALLAKRHETFAKKRLEIMANDRSYEERVKQITPLINNYSSIFLECLKGKGRLKAIVQKCYCGVDDKAFKEFTRFLAQQEIPTKRFWASNNLNGFISLVEAFLLEDIVNEERKSA